MNKWTPEFEALWRARFAEIKGDSPFRAFVLQMSNLTCYEAFELCLNEVDRLRIKYETELVDRMWNDVE